MRFQRFALSCLFVLGAVARPPKSQSVFRAADGSACPSGVHIIGVRGTLEKTGFGAMQNITDKLKQKLSAVDAYAIDYPASGIAIGDDGEPNPDLREYSASEAQGYAALKTHLEDYSTLCPDTKVVLMGYSQASGLITQHTFEFSRS